MPEPEPPRRVMVIMAHPDDPEFACAGTVARWAAQGTEVIYVLITSGDKGSDDPDMTREALMALREQEERAAARLLGVKEVVFLRYPDGELAPTLDLRRDLVREIRRYRPDAVVVPDPTRRFWDSGYINHSDHRVAGEVALDAIYPAAGNRRFFPELLAEGFLPHAVREVYVADSTEPNLTVDISATLDLKIAALKEHRSQLDPAQVDKWFRGGENGGETFRPVEEFRRIVLG